MQLDHRNEYLAMRRIQERVPSSKEDHKEDSVTLAAKGTFSLSLGWRWWGQDIRQVVSQLADWLSAPITSKLAAQSMVQSLGLSGH